MKLNPKSCRESLTFALRTVLWMEAIGGVFLYLMGDTLSVSGLNQTVTILCAYALLTSGKCNCCKRTDMLVGNQ